MVSTPLWAIPEVAAAQTQKEVTINNALVWLEGALADDYAVTWSSNAATVGNNAFTQHMTLLCPDNATSAVLTVPLLKKFFIVNNALGSHQVTVGGATGATVVVPSGAIAICLCDGSNCYTITALATTAGVLSIGGVAGTIGVTGNLGVVSGTLTLSGMAAEAVPAVGPLVSDGTHVSAGGVVGNLGFSAGTFSLAGMAAESIPAVGIVYSTGTHIAAATLASTFAFSGGTLSLTGVELTAHKGAANGYAGLDGSGLVPFNQLPAALSEALWFAGTWNATSGTTSLSTVLASGTGTPGMMFKVATAGTTSLDTISQWNVGDQVAFSGVSNTWVKIDGIATEVLSVGGATGAIGVAGNLSVAGGTLTLSGMAAENVPAAGIVYSTGTHVAAATLDPSLTLTGATLSFRTVATGKLLGNGGTIAAAPSDITLSGSFTLSAANTLSLAGLGAANGIATLDSNGYVPLSQMQSEVTWTDIAIPMVGKPAAFTAGPPATGRTCVLLDQTLTLPANLTSTNVVFITAATGTPSFVVSGWHAGTITPRGTLTLNSSGTLTISGAGTADVIMPPGDMLLLDNPSNQDATLSDGCVTIRTKKVAG